MSTDRRRRHAEEGQRAGRPRPRPEVRPPRLGRGDGGALRARTRPAAALHPPRKAQRRLTLRLLVPLLLLFRLLILRLLLLLLLPLSLLLSLLLLFLLLLVLVPRGVVLPRGVEQRLQERPGPPRRLGSGRIAVSETETPDKLVNGVYTVGERWCRARMRPSPRATARSRSTYSRLSVLSDLSRGTWARVTIAQFRHWALETG
jgi:hypothetical protein